MTNNQPPILNNPAAAQNPQPPAGQQPPYDDEIDLLELWRALMRGKWIIIGFTAVFSIASVFYALSLPNMYKSTAVLAPAEPSGGGLGKLGQLGGLASLAGINLGGGGSNKTAEALEILQSWAFIEEFIQEQDIAPEVFAVSGWDYKTRKLLYNEGVYDLDVRGWKQLPGEDETAKPSSWQLYQTFMGYISVLEDKNTAFKNLSIEYYSPEIAKVWVDALVHKVNRKLQERDASSSERNISFLKEQIEQTALASMQSVFYDLIEEQTKTLMLAKGSAEYVFKTVSEARVSEQRSKPKRALICVVGAFLGGFLGVFIALIRYFIRK